MKLENALNKSKKTLHIGMPKIGKTYGILKSALEECKNRFTIFIGTVDRTTKEQVYEQAIEVGWGEENIIQIADVSKIKLMKENLKEKLLIVNLHESYDTRILSLMEYAKVQGLTRYLIEDEYDTTCAMLPIKKKQVRHDMMRAIYMAMDYEDYTSFISATNVACWLSDFTFDKVVKIAPYKDGYKGPRDILIKSVADTMTENWELGKFEMHDAEWVKGEVEKRGPGLLKLTNLVNKNATRLYHERIKEALVKVGLKVVCDNGKYNPTKEEINEADVIIAGQRADRQKFYRTINWMVLTFGNNSVQSSIVQWLRLCGYRTGTPVLFVPNSKKETVELAIEQEYMVLDFPEKEWSIAPRRIENKTKGCRILPLKIANISNTEEQRKPEKIIDIETYFNNDLIQEMYPLLDKRQNTLRGTRQYDGRTAETIAETVLNVHPNKPVRNQPNRNFLLINSNGELKIPERNEQGTAFTLNCNYEKDKMDRGATFWFCKETQTLKIGLWNNLLTQNTDLATKYTEIKNYEQNNREKFKSK